MSCPNSPLARIASAIVLPFRWMLVLVAVLAAVVVVPLVEFAAELYGLVRRCLLRSR